MTGVSASHAYGPSPWQRADLWLPDSSYPAPVAVLIHGGFWQRMETKDALTAHAANLAACGWAVWNIEYRCVGEGGGFAPTITDVFDAIDHLANPGIPETIDRSRVYTVGHSAGGHLAMCAVSSLLGEAIRGRPRRIDTSGAVGISAVASFSHESLSALARRCIRAFMVQTAIAKPRDRLPATPRELLPLGVPVLLVHGRDDTMVPSAVAAEYIDAARAAGDDVELALIDGGHLEALEPGGTGWALVRQWLIEQASIRS